MRELGDPGWRTDAVRLLEHLDAVLAINTAAYWRALEVNAWRNLEGNIAQLTGYTCSVTRAYLRAALADESLLDFGAVRERFFDPVDSPEVPVAMNDMMAGTFGLAFIDIAQRIIAWLRANGIAWERAMVLLAGRTGRATAGVTWATNNMCHLLWRASNERLAAERVLIAPFAPSFVADDVTDAVHAAKLDAGYREMWNRTRASTELAREMFAGYPGYRAAVPVAPVIDAATGERRRDARIGIAARSSRAHHSPARSDGRSGATRLKRGSALHHRPARRCRKRSGRHLHSRFHRRRLPKECRDVNASHRWFVQLCAVLALVGSPAPVAGTNATDRG